MELRGGDERERERRAFAEVDSDGTSEPRRGRHDERCQRDPRRDLPGHLSIGIIHELQ